MFKRLLYFILISLFCINPMNVYASEQSTSPMPETIKATLTSDSGETFDVIGEKVNVFTDLYDSRDFSTSYTERSYDESETYKFTLYSNQSNSLTASEYDGSKSVIVYLTINYKTRNTPTEYLLTSVSGRWSILDQRVSVTNANLTYGCSGSFPYPTMQKRTRNASNYFYYYTGFSDYTIQYSGSMGAYLTLNLKMGPTRQWSFSMSNYLF